MSVKEQKPIVIFRGDNTAAFDLRTIKILLTGDLDLTNATARFDLLGFTKSWTTEEVATGELSIVFDSAQTKAFALGPQTGTLRLFDMSTGMPRQLTVVNKIPFFVTNNVCEIDSQSYGINVQVSGGDVINIEFKVGAGAVEGKADKVKDATAGDLASLTEDGNLEDSGIPKTDVLRKSQMDSTPTAGSQNPVTSDGIKQAIDAATPEDYAQVKAQVETNTQGIAAINGKIPSQASTQNQLADKDFVNSSIATNTATFRGSYNLVSDLGLTVSATEQQVSAAIATKLASLVPPVVPENNDYCFVLVPKSDAEPSVVVRVDRYKCTVTESGGVTTRVWGYEWSLNNSSFTADQWAAISSGITSALVAKLGALPTADELAAALLAKYEKPSAGIPKTDLAAGVQASLDKADTALQTAPVTSVNSKTGAVTLTASDVGALPTTGGTMTGTLRMDKSVIELEDLTGYKSVLQCTGTGGDFFIKGYDDQGTLCYSLIVPQRSGNLALLDSPAFIGTPTAPTPAAGDDSTKVATTAFVQDAKRYTIGAVQTISTASQDSSGGTTINYGKATLADRTVNQVAVTASLDELRVSFPAAVSGKVRDFELRLEVGTGSAALTAPAIVVVPPTGETITLENADGAWPTLEDGAATAKGVTTLYFSETAAGKFLVKGEAMKEVA